jgi:hypothetical protein
MSFCCGKPASPEPRGERQSPQAGARTHIHGPCAVASGQDSGEGSTPTLEPIERQGSPLVIAGCHLVVVAASHGRRHRNLASPPPSVHVSWRSYSPRIAAAPGSASVESQSSTSVMSSTATPSRPSGIAGPVELGQSPLEQAALGVVVDQRQGPVVGLAGFRRASEAAVRHGSRAGSGSPPGVGVEGTQLTPPHTGPVP